MNNYKEHECYACGTPIMVLSHDVSPRYYCVTCAWSKLGAYDNHTGLGVHA